MKHHNGHAAGVLAFIIWGAFPLFWQLLHHIAALEILMHRIIWSCVFMAAWLSIFRQWRGVFNIFKTHFGFLHCLLAALLIAANWGIYIAAVNAHNVVETSLGYYIGPLINILIGMVWFKETLRYGQWLALVLATSGVVFLILKQGYVPFSALGVAITFSLYGAVKKQLTLPASHSLFIESLLLTTPALIFLVMSPWQNQAAFIHNTQDALLLAIGGAVTAVPLLLFGYSAKRIPLTILGFVQYIGPTLQLSVSVLWLGERFDHTRLVGFSLVWLALILLTAETIACKRHAKTGG